MGVTILGMANALLGVALLCAAVSVASAQVQCTATSVMDGDWGTTAVWGDVRQPLWKAREAVIANNVAMKSAAETVGLIRIKAGGSLTVSARSRNYPAFTVTGGTAPNNAACVANSPSPSPSPPTTLPITQSMTISVNASEYNADAKLKKVLELAYGMSIKIFNNVTRQYFPGCKVSSSAARRNAKVTLKAVASPSKQAAAKAAASASPTAFQQTMNSNIAAAKQSLGAGYSNVNVAVSNVQAPTIPTNQAAGSGDQTYSTLMIVLGGCILLALVGVLAFAMFGTGGGSSKTVVVSDGGVSAVTGSITEDLENKQI